MDDSPYKMGGYEPFAVFTPIFTGEIARCAGSRSLGPLRSTVSRQVRSNRIEQKDRRFLRPEGPH
jgi:hypothetical protein